MLPERCNPVDKEPKQEYKGISANTINYVNDATIIIVGWLSILRKLIKR